MNNGIEIIFTLLDIGRVNMVWLLVLIIIILLPLGFWIMIKIDDFLALPTTFPDTKMRLAANSNILVCGKSDFANLLMQILEENNKPYIYFDDETSINSEQSYLCLLAVDRDDYKNLSISIAGRTRFRVDNQVLLCNDRTYEKIFRDSGVPFIYTTEEPMKMLLIAEQRFEDRKNDY